MANILVTGGAGYVGSHMTYALADRGDTVIVVDNLSTGIRGLVAPEAEFVEGDVGDRALIRGLLRRHRVEAVVHFAGSVVVPESVEQPLRYYANNTMKSLALIESCLAEGVKQFIFSSTAAVYGMGENRPASENDNKAPINPYGRSKLMTEWILEDAAKAHGFRYVALRYFNVAGADPHGRTGQSTPRATHLIKRACQVALERVPELEIFGGDFPTRDGTGVRDYIHVSDLIECHLLALKHLRKGGEPKVLNCGYGQGFSVREVVEAVARQAGRSLPTRLSPRRAGDPAQLIADPARIRAELGWRPSHADLGEIVASAYAWEQRQNA